MSVVSLRALAMQIFAYGMGDALVKLLSLATVPVYSRVFGPSHYGVLSIVGAITAILSAVGNLGLSSGVQREYYAVQDPNDRAFLVSTGYWGLLGWSLLVCAAGLVCAPLMSYAIFGSTELGGLVALAILGIPAVQAVAFCQDTLRLHFRAWRFTFFSVSSQTVQAALGIALVTLTGLGLYGVFLGTLLAAAAALVAGTMLIAKELRFRFGFAAWKRFAAYGAPLVLGGLAFPAFVLVDRLILEHFHGAEAVGRFAIASNVAQAMGLLSASFAKAWSPVGWQLRHNHPGHRAIFADVLLYLLVIFGVAAVGVSAFAPEIVGVLAPSSFAEGARAVPPLTLYMMANVSILVTSAGISISGHSKYLMVIIWIAVTLNVGLDLLLVPPWGVIGAGIATAIAETLMSIAIALVGQRLYRLPFDVLRLGGLGMLLLAGLLASYALPAGWSVAAVSAKLALVALFTLSLFETKIVTVTGLRRTAALLGDPRAFSAPTT